MTNNNFRYKYRIMPSAPQDPLFFNYGVSVNIAPTAKSIFTEDQTRGMLRIVGQKKIENPAGDDYIFNHTIGNLILKEGNVTPGKATLEIVYTFESSVGLTRGEQTLFNHAIHSKEDDQSYYKNFKTEAEARAYWTNNKEVIRSEIYRKVIEQSVAKANELVSKRCGFWIATGSEQLKQMNTPKHSENAAIVKNTTELADKLKTLDGITPVSETETVDYIAYFKAIPERFPSDSKSDAKLRYIAYHNLCVIYLLLDQPGEAIPYADKLIANDQSPRDGERFKKEAGKLIETLFESPSKTRQFDTQPYLDQLGGGVRM